MVKKAISGFFTSKTIKPKITIIAQIKFIILFYEMVDLNRIKTNKDYFIKPLKSSKYLIHFTILKLFDIIQEI